MLGQRIRQVRQAKGLTQADLADGAVSKGYISLIEKGLVKPSLETLGAIAARLGASVDSLLGADRPPAETATAALLALAEAAVRQRDYVRVDRLLSAVRYVAQTYGVDEAHREALLLMGTVEIELRRFEEASWTIQRARTLAEEAGDFWRLGRALTLEGRVRVRQRRFEEASRVLVEALRTLRRARAGRDPARIEALITLGTARFFMGDMRGARRRYREAARSYVARHNLVLRGRAWWGLGLVYRKQKQFLAAEEALLEARRAFEAAEELRDLVRVLQGTAQLLHELGRASEALEHLHHALRVMDHLGMSADQATVLTEIGRIHVSLGDLDQAEYFAKQALTQAHRVGDPVEEAEANVVLARIALARGQQTEGRALLRQALDTFRTRSMTARAEQAGLELSHALDAREEPPAASLPRLEDLPGIDVSPLPSRS